MASSSTHVGYNDLNRLEYSNRQGYSNFDLSRLVQTSFRFADITPFLCTRTVFGDNFTEKMSQDLQNYVTLKSPLMGTLRSHQDYFCMPKRGMLPHTYRELLVNPNKGEDVPELANPGFHLRGLVNAMLGLFSTHIANNQETENTVYSADWYLLVMLYNICGYGTLPDFFNNRSAAFAYPASSEVGLNFDKLGAYTFGQVFDRVFGEIIKAKPIVTIKNSDEVAIGAYELSSPESVRRMFFDLSQTDQEWYVSETGVKYKDFVPFIDFASKFGMLQSYDFDDILPYVAYQMICSEFFTVDTVDNVFTGDLWLKSMESLVNQIDSKIYPQYFQMNSIRIQYDLFSRRVQETLMVKLNTVFKDSASYAYIPNQFLLTAYYLNLFCIRPALRFSDYFAGSRTRPLAVGDVSAPVVDNSVSAIDTTKSISYQRFLNAVNRARQTVEGYVKGIFGVDAPYNPNSPRALASEIFKIKDIVNINTADNQGNRAANISSSSGSKFAFDMRFNEEVYIIGVNYIDYLVTYPFTTDRFNYHKNRYDDFQPMLQDIGDQIVYTTELHSCVPMEDDNERAFGYQLQDAEYKFALPTAHGGFISQLQSWAFVDYDSYKHNNVSSDFIRLKPYMFDRYFSGLSGMSPETYFHFMSNVFVSEFGRRKMQFKPGIL